MLDFSDKPYRYFPPKRFWPTTRLLTAYNRYYMLPRFHRIASMDVTGYDDVLGLTGRGDRFLFLPNHSTHCDAPMWLEAITRIGLSTLIMAAYDVFLRGRLDAWVMQRLGAFSVDRDASDSRSMTQARNTLMDGKHALTIFPEGNVYLRNDRVTPFNEGAALLGLRAAKDLAERSVRVWAVPVSIKATHATDTTAQVLARLKELEAAVELGSNNESPPLDRLRQVGIAALHRNLRLRGIDAPDTEDPAELINRTADAVLSRLEAKISLNKRAGDSNVERLKKARRAIHQVRIDPERAGDHAAAAGWADEAMLAFRILSYDTGYVVSNPTLDRFAETVEKLAEDIYAKLMPPIGPRHAYVRVGRPIDLGGHLEQFNRKARIATRELTEEVEAAVQKGLDDAVANNTRPGSRVTVR